jgi:ribosomal protein S18 acetylase RimI-like enzyme
MAAHIRLARDEDWPAIWPLLREVFRAGTTYAVDPQISAEAARAYWMIAPRATYVAETAAGIVGTYYIRTNQPGGGSHVCNCGYVAAPAARRQGLAEQMCRASQDQALALGYRAMQFNFVLASNDGALRLWHRLGFVTVGTIPEAFDHPTLGLVDAHVMHKRLGADLN